MQYPILTLKSGKERSLEHRHPWLFSGAVKTAPKAAEGDIVAVHDNKGQLMAYGFYATQSQITCRMFDFGSEAKTIDAHYWQEKIRRAYTLRQSLLPRSAGNAYRLIHAEGDFFPGLIVDVYGTVAVVQLLIKGTERLAEVIVEALRTLGFEYVYLKTKESSKRFEAMSLEKGWLGTPFPQAQVEVQENGFKFLVDVEKGQKTGFFIDQRDNRLLLQHYAAGKRVLNTFSYTGGFSVYALAGGASEVHSVDISQEASNTCVQNIALNFPDKISQHQALTADCFDYLRQMEESYDVIVLDPPAFAKTARAVPNATRGYKDINLLAFKKIRPGGLLFTFSCSGSISKELFRKVVFGAAADAGREIRIIHQLTQPPDHPINIYHPEGEYLKGLALYVE
jgi:23S rRNA (cytosine1962-C5)-methyltransferase